MVWGRLGFIWWSMVGFGFPGRLSRAWPRVFVHAVPSGVIRWTIRRMPDRPASHTGPSDACVCVSACLAVLGPCCPTFVGPSGARCRTVRRLRLGAGLCLWPRGWLNAGPSGWSRWTVRRMPDRPMSHAGPFDVCCVCGFWCLLCPFSWAFSRGPFVWVFAALCWVCSLPVADTQRRFRGVCFWAWFLVPTIHPPLVAKVDPTNS